MCVCVCLFVLYFMPQIFKTGCNMFCVDPNEGHKLKHIKGLVFRNLYSVAVFSAYCSILNNISKANRSNSLQSSHKTAPIF